MALHCPLWIQILAMTGHIYLSGNRKLQMSMGEDDCMARSLVALVLGKLYVIGDS